jgi:cytochrome b
MNVHPTIDGASDAPEQRSVPMRRVIDAPTRMFHWLFALCFVGAYISADSERWRLLHVTLGYTFGALLLFRVAYGMFGPRQASLGVLWRKLSGAPLWFKSISSPSQINWRQGQNLLMALTVAGLLAMVVPLTVSGYGTYNDWGSFLGGDWLEDVHEFFGEAFLIVVLVHLAFVVGISLLRKNNHATPMVTGYVAGSGPNLVQNNRAWLAALLLISVLAYWSWEWRQSPAGLVSGTPPSSQQSGKLGGRDDDDDD